MKYVTHLCEQNVIASAIADCHIVNVSVTWHQRTGKNTHNKLLIPNHYTMNTRAQATYDFLVLRRRFTPNYRSVFYKEMEDWMDHKPFRKQVEDLIAINDIITGYENFFINY